MCSLLGFRSCFECSAFLLSGIGEADWAFKTILEVSEQELSAPNIDLVFDGLDTFSVVSLVSTNLLAREMICAPTRKQPL